MRVPPAALAEPVEPVLSLARAAHSVDVRRRRLELTDAAVRLVVAVTLTLTVSVVAVTMSVTVVAVAVAVTVVAVVGGQEDGVEIVVVSDPAADVAALGGAAAGGSEALGTELALKGEGVR